MPNYDEYKRIFQSEKNKQVEAAAKKAEQEQKAYEYEAKKRAEQEKKQAEIYNRSLVRAEKKSKEAFYLVNSKILSGFSSRNEEVVEMLRAYSIVNFGKVCDISSPDIEKINFQTFRVEFQGGRYTIDEDFWGRNPGDLSIDWYINRWKKSRIDSMIWCLEHNILNANVRILLNYVSVPWSFPYLSFCIHGTTNDVHYLNECTSLKDLAKRLAEGKPITYIPSNDNWEPSYSHPFSRQYDYY